MSRYIPNTRQQQKEMLEALGLDSAEQLFKDIPGTARLNKELKLPEALSEPELVSHMQKLSQKNAYPGEYTCFLGAGAYDHYIPSVVGHILSRQEFYTAYTPYQPEISQGTLQTAFEYQTMICELTGMDVANASMYDGATGLAEAGVMACQTVRRKEVLAARSIHPECRAVLNTYGSFNDCRMAEIGYKDGRLDMEELEARISSETAAVIVQNPNFFGVIEDLAAIAEVVHKHGALFIVSANPVSLAILKSPGDAGADIVVGEGQPLGNSLSFGGPYLGFFAARKELLRKMPGRIVGETVDAAGRRGFVLTIQTREQHIRREKATSNICSNQALNALAATVYLTVMGKQGLREVAELCLQKAHYAYDKLLGTGKFKAAFTAPFFNEFLVNSTEPVAELNKRLLAAKIIGGYGVAREYPELEKGWLIAVTEKRTRQEIDTLAGKAVEA